MSSLTGTTGGGGGRKIKLKLGSLPQQQQGAAGQPLPPRSAADTAGAAQPAASNVTAGTVGASSGGPLKLRIRLSAGSGAAPAAAAAAAAASGGSAGAAAEATAGHGGSQGQQQQQQPAVYDGVHPAGLAPGADASALAVQQYLEQQQYMQQQYLQQQSSQDYMQQQYGQDYMQSMQQYTQDPQQYMQQHYSQDQYLQQQYFQQQASSQQQQQQQQRPKMKLAVKPKLATQQSNKVRYTATGRVQRAAARGVARLIAEEGGVPQDHSLAAPPPGADTRFLAYDDPESPLAERRSTRAAQRKAIESEYVDPDEMDFEGEEFLIPAETEPKPEKPKREPKPKAEKKPKADKPKTVYDDDDDFDEMDLAYEDNVDDEDFDLDEVMEAEEAMEVRPRRGGGSRSRAAAPTALDRPQRSRRAAAAGVKAAVAAAYGVPVEEQTADQQAAGAAYNMSAGADYVMGGGALSPQPSGYSGGGSVQTYSAGAAAAGGSGSRGGSRGRRTGSSRGRRGDSDEDEDFEDLVDEESGEGGWEADGDDDDDVFSREVIGGKTGGDYSQLTLKADHYNRPLWVTSDGRIFLETYSPIYKQAYDFLIAIAEPVCRPESIHEYVLTSQSLYAAVSVGLDRDTILGVLDKLSKVRLTPALKKMIKDATKSYGKVKLVLKQNRFWVETSDPEVLEELLHHPVIHAARCFDTPGADKRGLVRRKAVKEHAAAQLFKDTMAAAAEGAAGRAAAANGSGLEAADLVARAAATIEAPAAPASTAEAVQATAPAAPAAPAAGGGGRFFDPFGSESESDPEDYHGVMPRSRPRPQPPMAAAAAPTTVAAAGAATTTADDDNDEDIGVPRARRRAVSAAAAAAAGGGTEDGDTAADGSAPETANGTSAAAADGLEGLDDADAMDGVEPQQQQQQKRQQQQQDGAADSDDDDGSPVVGGRRRLKRKAAADADLDSEEELDLDDIDTEVADPDKPHRKGRLAATAALAAATGAAAGDGLDMDAEAAAGGDGGGGGLRAMLQQQRKEAKEKRQQEKQAKQQQREAQAAPAAAAGPAGDGEGGYEAVEEEEDPEREVFAFEIRASEVEKVKKACLPKSTAGDNTALDLPLLEEYDFTNDVTNPPLDIGLKKEVQLRPYQEKSLSKMFGNGRARSGIIVLPCGAGKSLVGVAAAARIKKSCLCLCTSSVSVDQWSHQFSLWTGLSPEEHIVKFVAGTSSQDQAAAENMRKLKQACVCVTTFNMIAHKGHRSEYGKAVMDLISSREWGLLIMDEVHVVPARMFRQVIGIVKAHCKLGLTATLVREDELIGDLNFLIGPKMYEANWLDLTRAGHIANVQCVEVWCPMTREFYAEYLKREGKNDSIKQLLYVMNPNKFMVCQYLIDWHERIRGDKVIVFSDNVYALEAYARALGKPFIYGKTSHAERTQCLSMFKNSNRINTVFLSKVGDNSLDIPEANVLIQISSHAGSRRQEAQRLGRILRAKKGKPGSGEEEEFSAFFYTLVSRDTQEMYYSAKRQQFLVDQGYAFKVLPALHNTAAAEPWVKYRTQAEQIELLSQVLAAKSQADELAKLCEKEEVGDADDLVAKQRGFFGHQRGKGRKVGARNMSAATGGAGYVYNEFKSGPRGTVAMQERAQKNKKTLMNLNKRSTPKL